MWEEESSFSEVLVWPGEPDTEPDSLGTVSHLILKPVQEAEYYYY